MEKKFKRELNERLTAIQAELLARKITGEDASAGIDAAKALYEKKLAAAKRHPRRWFKTTLVCAGLAVVVCVAFLFQLLPDDNPILRALALCALGSMGVIALVLFREMRRVRERAREFLGLENAALVLDAPLVELACHEMEVALVAIEVKNQSALVAALDDEALAELHGGLLDFLARRVADHRGILLGKGHGHYVAVFRKGGPADPIPAALAVARRIQGDLAKVEASVTIQGRSAHLGVGLAAGKVQTGTVGGSGQQSFVCVGRTVELALELAAAAGWGEVLLSDELFGRMEGDVKAEAREPLRSLVMDSIIRIHAIVITPETSA